MLCAMENPAQTYCSLLQKCGKSANAKQIHISGKRGKDWKQDCQMTREAFMAEALAGYRELRRAANARGQLMVSKTALDAMVQLVGLTK